MKPWPVPSLLVVVVLAGCSASSTAGTDAGSLVPEWAGNRSDDEIDQLAVAETPDGSIAAITDTSSNSEETAASWSEIEEDLTTSKQRLDTNDKAIPRSIDPDIEEWLAARRAEVQAPELP